MLHIHSSLKKCPPSALIHLTLNKKIIHVTQGRKIPLHTPSPPFEFLEFLRDWFFNLCVGVCDTPSAYDEPKVRPSPARAWGTAAAAFRIMLCVHCRLHVGMNKSHSRHPSPSPCRFLDVPYCLKNSWCDSYLCFFLFTLPGNCKHPSKSFGSYSTQRLGYNLWLRKSLNGDAGRERCSRGTIAIVTLCFCTCGLLVLLTRTVDLRNMWRSLCSKEV